MQPLRGGGYAYRAVRLQLPVVVGDEKADVRAGVLDARRHCIGRAVEVVVAVMDRAVSCQRDLEGVLAQSREVLYTVILDHEFLPVRILVDLAASRRIQVHC